MAKQIVKGLAMLMVTLGLALASAAVANGQSGQRLIAQVPFDFIVAEKALRAGRYDVRYVNGAGDAVAISDTARGNEILRLTHEADTSGQREKNARLVFHRYGNTYFLSQVWMAGESSGRQLPRTGQERAIDRELTAIASSRGEAKPLYEVVEIIATVR